MIWMVLFLGCEQLGSLAPDTAAFAPALPEGATIVITDELSNTVKSISAGVQIEGQRTVVERQVFDGGALGADGVAYRDTVTAFRVEHVYGGTARVWDSTTGEKVPKELAHYPDIAARVTDVALAADGTATVRRALSAAALDAQPPGEGVTTWSDARYLDPVTLALLGAPRGSLAVGDSWKTVSSNETSLSGLEYGADLSITWTVKEISATEIVLDETVGMKSKQTGRGDAFSVAAVDGTGKLVLDRKSGLPSEFSEKIRYTLNSADETAEQVLERLRYYKVK